MKQAIEEGFILDVLKGYTTYSTYFKINKAIEEDPRLNERKAKISLARYLSLHPHNISQKTEIIIEHFRKVVSHKLGGRAKAMVVTSSRLHAVRYKLAFDEYIKEKGYRDVKTLIAFSGSVKDGNDEYKEAEMNGFKEKELPAKFATEEYSVLIVAEKSQTGFDQPLLYAMYVDKKLSGIKAVQTLSRLNRMCPGKKETFVLDFANDEQEIIDSFQTFYQKTSLERETDPNLLYDQVGLIEKSQILRDIEIDNFAKVFFQPNYDPKNQAKLYAYVTPARDRYKQLPEEMEEGQVSQDEVKSAMISFVRTYSYLSQIMPFYDARLEKMYPYFRLLLKALPRKKGERNPFLDDKVELEYYRLEKRGDYNLELQSEDTEITGVQEGGIKKKDEEPKSPLSDIINLVNERFGTEFEQADRLVFEQIVEDCVADEELKQQVNANDFENFKYPFRDKYDDKVIDRMEQNNEVTQKMMAGDELANTIFSAIVKEVYKRLKVA